MVLLSASICTRDGKVLIGRQFMEMTRSRVEGLLAAFPKLIDSKTEHTFVETDSIRYVYQAMESLYMVLITTKNSNILEDLKTLRLFTKVVPEYCPAQPITDEDVTDCAFDLIFAFDEIVALGYRENVSLNEIRTYIEMESHAENVAKMVRRNKENEVKELRKRKEKEITARNRAHGGPSGTGGGPSNTASSGGGGGGYMADASRFMEQATAITDAVPVETVAAPKPTKTKKSKGGGLKLGSKGKKKDDFESKLAAEGQSIGSFGDDDSAASKLETRKSSNANPEPAVDMKAVHIKVEEKITLEATRDGDIESMEIKGFVFATVSDAAVNKIQISSTTNSDKAVSFQTHPNVDKKAWAKDNTIVLKNSKPYPDGTEVGVLKWKFKTDDESLIPMSVTCWPTINPNGSADVNVDYELQDTSLTLTNVTISIPVPGQPVVDSSDGDTTYHKRDGVLEWTLDIVDSDNAEGSLEFKVDAADNDEFFPVSVNFSSETTWAGFAVEGVEQAGADVDYSSEVSFGVDSYEYV